MERESILEAIEKLKELIGEIDEDEAAQSLREDYNAFFVWALGEKEEKCTKEEMCKRWKRMHPDLPVPRVFETKMDLGKVLSTACLFMDAYPLFLESLDD